MHQRRGSRASTHVAEETLPTREMDVLGGEPRGGMPVEQAAGARAASAGAGEPESNQPIGHGRVDMVCAAFAGTTITRRLASMKGTISGLPGGITIRPGELTSSGPSVNGLATCIDSTKVAHANFGGISRTIRSAAMASSRFAS